MNYGIVKNNKYGFYQISPTPSEDDINKFYSEEFYSGDYKKFNDSSLEVQTENKNFYDGHFSDIYSTLLEIVNKKPENIDLLDIGCGWGQALIYFKEKGINCFGFDPAKEAIEYANNKGINAKTAGMQTMDVFEGKKFDVVIMLNVLEHLSDPEKVLIEINKKVLKPGGLIIIDVPNEFNKLQEIGKKVHKLNDWWVCPPGHLNYFNTDSLTAILGGTGYETVYTESSFPLELFLAFGDNYVEDGLIGSDCHKKRVQFELNCRKTGNQKFLKELYQKFSEMNLGRQIVAYAKKENNKEVR
jgi:2-polyprenyl-3-methyl-5-hydroxy-6-metoxy-1,4-benzoquinol methylase